MNLIEGLQTEIARVKEIIEIYEDPELKGAGKFAALMMRADIEIAKRCINGDFDVVECLKVYKSLTEYTT